jgi:hypothetical protein
MCMQHYCLAANVIGSEARGTMRRAVGALKVGSLEGGVTYPLEDRQGWCSLLFLISRELSAQLHHQHVHVVAYLLHRLAMSGPCSLSWMLPGRIRLLAIVLCSTRDHAEVCDAVPRHGL